MEGKQFGLPYQALVTGLWYNKALFAQYGLKIPKLTMIIAAAKTFKVIMSLLLPKAQKMLSAPGRSSECLRAMDISIRLITSWQVK